MSGLPYRHQRVQRLRKLVGRRAARDDDGSFVLEGVNLLEEALGAGTEIEAVYVDADWAGRSPSGGPAAGAAPARPGAAPDGPGTATARPGAAPAEAAAAPVGPVKVPAGPGEGEQDGPLASVPTAARLSTLLQRCHAAGARIFELDHGVLPRVAGTVTPQPVLTVARIPRCTLYDLGARRPRLVLVCVDVRDPGNAGTVARSAWAAGADAVVCTEGTVDPWNPKAVRASAGAVLRISMVSAGGAAEVLAEMGTWGLRRWGTVVRGGADYAAADLSMPSALVLGNEASGLPAAALAGVLDGLLSIPMAGGAESLNVGMAATVLCFEAARQRRRGRIGGEHGPASPPD